MMLYLLEQKIPRPDVVIPLANPILSSCPSHAIAKIVSEIWDIPIANALSASLIFEEFTLRKKICIADKNVLLVGDRLNARFFQAGHALIAGYPKSIIGSALFT